MNKNEHVLFMIAFFIFTLTVGGHWIEEYLGSTRQFSSPDAKRGLRFSDINDKDDNDIPVYQGPVNKTFGDMLNIMQRQKTNNDQYLTSGADKASVIESFVQRRPHSNNRVNMY